MWWAPEQASMPMRQHGTFASRRSIWPRESFSCKTIAPRVSRPTRWKVFLPRSMPIVAIVVGAQLGDMGRTPLRSSTRKAYAIAGGSTAGPSHYRKFRRDRQPCGTVTTSAQELVKDDTPATWLGDGCERTP